MAKAKTSGASSQPAFLKDLAKQYGNVIIKGNQLLEQRKDYKIVPVSPAIDLAINGGIREGTWVMLSGAPKCGKAQPYSSMVYTPSGPKTMEDIEPGDVVCTPDNGVATVRDVFPQGVRPVYKVMFSDGTHCRCDKEHLWKIQGRYSWRTKTASQIKNRLESTVQTYRVPSPGVVHFDDQPTSIDPFLLGAFLARGSCKNQNTISLSPLKNRPGYVGKINALLEKRYGPDTKLNEDFEIVNAKEIISELMAFYVLCPRSRRFVPVEYIYNNWEVRNELIAGVFGIAGKQTKNSTALEVLCRSAQLICNIAEICRSLGFFVVVHKLGDSNLLKISGQDFSRFLSPDQEPVPMKIKHKRIVSISEDGEERCKCIELDNTEHLYITDGMSVTHNTTTAMQLAYNCQKEDRPVIYINSEGRLNQLNFEVEGLDPEKMFIVTAEDQPLSAEAFLDIAHKLISVPENRGALCIIDSISSLIPAKDLDGDVTGSMRPGLPKILSNFVKKCGQVVPNNKNIMCMITHVIANTSGYGKHSMADGGIKIQFQADTRMEVKSINPWVQNDVRVGQAVNWDIYYSGLGAKNFTCQSWLRYGYGLDNVQELLIIAEELGLIDKAGSWMTCDFLFNNPAFLNKINPEILLDESGSYVDEELALKACKNQGQEKTYHFIKTTPGLLEYLNQEIKTMLA